MIPGLSDRVNRFMLEVEQREFTARQQKLQEKLDSYPTIPITTEEPAKSLDEQEDEIERTVERLQIKLEYPAIPIYLEETR